MDMKENDRHVLSTNKFFLDQPAAVAVVSG